MSKTFKEKSYIIDEFDLYKILGIEPSLQHENLILYYQELVRKYHPARHSFQLLSSQEIKEIRLIFSKISIAYNILSDPNNREKYDQERNRVLNEENISDLKELYERFKDLKREKPFKDKLHILNEADLYVILDVDPEIPEKDLRVHYRILVNKYHPDKYSFQMLSKQELNELNHIFAKISDAYNTLKDPEKRKQYDEHRKFILTQAKTKEREEVTLNNIFKDSDIDPEKARKEQADKFFNKGLKDFNNNLLDNAIKNFKSAIEILPKEAKFHCCLGLTLEKKGWHEYAKTEFRITLNFDPNNKTALEKINQNNVKNNPGLLSRIKSIFK